MGIRESKEAVAEQRPQATKGRSIRNSGDLGCIVARVPPDKYDLPAAAWGGFERTEADDSRISVPNCGYAEDVSLQL